MPDEVLIKDIVSRSDVNADKIFLLKTATEIYEAYGKLNTTLKGIGGGNIDTAKLKAAVGELNAAQKQLDASTRNLLDAKNRVAAADLKAEKIATQSAKTKLEEAKAEAVRTKSLIEQEKELTRLTEAEEKRAKKAALSNKAIGENYYALRDALAKANEAYRLFDKSTGDTVGFEKVKREAQEAKAKVDAFNRSLSPDGTLVGEYKTGILNFFKGIKGQIGQIAVGYIGLQALFQGGRKIIGLNFDFEDTANELRAITGVAGKDFDYLKDKAKETSTKTKFSAVEILESFKLIASAKPELLGNVEALNQVKDAAVILAQASGQTLPDAVDSLSKVLNQFGANASDSAKYIDALAAGAKFGAAEIPAITTALLEFGTQAKSSNISVQESIGLIELLAEKGIQGGEAGTKLRNILLSLNAVDALPKKAIDALQSYGVDLKKLSDTTLPLKDRIQELSKVQKDNSAIVQIFGKENFNAAQIVLQNVGRYDELAKQVTAVGVAQEQASVNTDSASTRFKILKNQLENLVTSKNVTAFLSGLASALSFLVGNLGIGIPLIITTVALTNTLAGSVIRVVVANGLLAAAYVVEKAQLIVNNGIKAAATTITNIYAAATIRSTAATGAAAIAYRVLALAIAFLSSPLGIVVGIIVAATTAFALFSGKTVEAVRSISAFGRGQEALNAINKRAQQGYIEQISSIDSLIAVLKDSSASADSKRIAMQKLIEINPKFRQALNGETIDLQKLALVYGDVTKAIYAKANADAAASLTAEKQQKVVAASTVRQRLEGQGAQVQNPNGIVSLRDISAAESAVLNETGIFKGVTVGENLDIAKNQLQPLIQAIKKVETERGKVLQAYLGQQAKINDDLQKVTGKPDSNTISAPPPGVDSQDLDGLRAKLVSVKLQIADLDKIKDKNTEQLTQLRTLRRQRTEIEKAIRELGGSTATGPSKSSVNDAATQAEQDRKSAYEINQRKIKEAIAAQKTIAEESTPDSTRPLEARQKQFEKEKELINATKDFELGAKKLSAVERQNIIDDAAQKERDAEQSLADDRVKIQLNADARQLADREKFIKALSNSKKKEVDALTDNFEDRNGVARRRADERLKNLNDEYAADKITKAQYEKEKEQIEAAYLKSSLLNEIDYYEALANLYDDDSKEHKAALNKIADLRKKASEIPINAKTDGKTKKDEEFDDEHAAKKVKEKLIQLGEELKDTFFSIIDSGFEKQKVALDEQIDLIQKRKEAELKANDQTAASAQDKAAQASLIESRAAAQTAALERAKRKIDVERAKFDRARALTQVAQEAAVGIIAAQKYGPPFSIILTALIAGIAAASAAKILKEPLPAYKYGTPTGGHPGGLAEVGDGGRSELVELPDGRMYVTPDYSTILNLPKGTVVKPDAKKELAKIPMAETDKAFKYSFKQIDNSHTIVDGINKGLDGVKRDLVHAIKNQPVPIIDTPNRIKGWVYGNASIKTLNNY